MLRACSGGCRRVADPCGLAAGSDARQPGSETHLRRCGDRPPPLWRAGAGRRPREHDRATARNGAVHAVHFGPNLSGRRGLGAESTVEALICTRWVRRAPDRRLMLGVRAGETGGAHPRAPASPPEARHHARGPKFEPARLGDLRDISTPGMLISRTPARIAALSGLLQVRGAPRPGTDRGSSDRRRREAPTGRSAASSGRSTPTANAGFEVPVEVDQALLVERRVGPGVAAGVRRERRVVLEREVHRPRQPRLGREHAEVDTRSSWTGRRRCRAPRPARCGWRRTRTR